VASLDPGTGNDPLWLLPSGPDQVHGAAMRGGPPPSFYRLLIRKERSWLRQACKALPDSFIVAKSDKDNAMASHPLATQQDSQLWKCLQARTNARIHIVKHIRTPILQDVSPCHHGRHVDRTAIKPKAWEQKPPKAQSCTAWGTRELLRELSALSDWAQFIPPLPVEASPLQPHQDQPILHWGHGRETRRHRHFECFIIRQVRPPADQVEAMLHSARRLEMPR